MDLSDFGGGNGAFATIFGPYGLGLFGTEGFDIDGIVDGFIAANG